MNMRQLLLGPALFVAVATGGLLVGCSALQPAQEPAAAQKTSRGPRTSEASPSPKLRSEETATVSPAIVEAEEFRLIDKEGKVRGLLRVDEAGTSSLTLYDKRGKARAILRVPEDGPSSLSFLDEQGNAPTTRHSLP